MKTGIWINFKVNESFVYMRSLITLFILISFISFGQSQSFVIISGENSCIKSVNLFDKTAVLSNVTLSNGDTVHNANNDVTDYIPVKPNTMYAVNTKRPIAFYDTSKNYLSSNNTITGDTATFTTPANTYFLRTVLGHFDNAPYYYLDMFQIVEQSNTYFPFRSPYGCFDSQWANQIWSPLGNSITDQFLWEPTVMDMVGLRSNEYGIGGTTIGGSRPDAMYLDSRINAIDTNSNLVSIMGGTNDWGQSVPLGTLNGLDTLTFYGGLNTIINKLLMRFPNAKILLITPPYAHKQNWVAAGWTDSLTNTQNLKLIDYVNAIKAVGTNRSVPVCDVYNLSGIDSSNWTNYLQPDAVHPDTLGGIRIGETVGAYLDSNYSIINTVVDENKQQSLNNYSLLQNFPNPFNPSTTINYSIPKSATVEIKVFNFLGQEVSTLIKEEKSAGNYELSFDASKLSSGVYFYRIQAGDFIRTKKMILLK